MEYFFSLGLSLLCLPLLSGWVVWSSRFKYHSYAVDSLHISIPDPTPEVGSVANVSPCMSAGTSNWTRTNGASGFLPLTLVPPTVFPFSVKGNFSLFSCSSQSLQNHRGLDSPTTHVSASAFCWLGLQNVPSQFSPSCFYHSCPNHYHLISVVTLPHHTYNSQPIFVELHLKWNLGHCLAAP